MFEYKVETYKIKKAESEINKLAQLGWRVIAVSSNFATLGSEIIVTFEKQIK